MASKKSKSAKRQRRERRFHPRSTTSPLLVRAIGGVGAAALGAGSWAQLGHTMMAKTENVEPLAAAPWLFAAGAILLGGAIWFGTSGDAVLHVGDGGVAIDKGGVRRIAWHAVESVRFEGDAVVVRGKDDAGVDLVAKAPLASQPQAAAWIVKEARARVPGVVSLGEDGESRVPEADTDAGEPLDLDAVQIVGKHCAASGTNLAYEPDGRVCPRCERVYHKAHVPEVCACGASLAHLRARNVSDPGVVSSDGGGSSGASGAAGGSRGSTDGDVTGA